MRRQKFYEFTAGRAGSGGVDLWSGKLTFISQTAPAETSAFDVSHIYNSERAITPNSNPQNNPFGTGFNLNLEQTLVEQLYFNTGGGTGGGDWQVWSAPIEPLESAEQPEQNVSIEPFTQVGIRGLVGRNYNYTDANGIRHSLLLRYYYTDANGEHQRIESVENVSIGQEGRLSTDVNGEIFEVFQETISKSRLTLKTQPDSRLEGYDQIDTRDEDIAALQDQLTEIDNALINLNHSIVQFDRNLHPENARLTGLRRRLEDALIAAEQLTVDQFNNIRDAMPNRASLANDKSGLYHLLESRAFQSHPSNSAPFEPQILNQQARVGRTSLTLESRTFGHQNTLLNNHIRPNLNAQSSLNSDSRVFEDASILELAARDIELRGIAYGEVARLEKQKEVIKFVIAILEDTLATSFLTTPDGTTLGFNKFSNLCHIIDGAGREAIIIRERCKTTGESLIAALVDSEGRETTFEYKLEREPSGTLKNYLKCIVDMVDRQTKFCYDNGRLTKITYPDGETSHFNYDEANNLTRVVEPSGLGVQLAFTNNRATSLHHLNNSGAVIANRGATINYLPNGTTTVIDSHSAARIDYIFCSRNEPLSEHITSEVGNTLTTTVHTGTHFVALHQRQVNNQMLIPARNIDWAFALADGGTISLTEGLSYAITHFNHRYDKVTHTEHYLQQGAAVESKTSYTYDSEGRLATEITVETHAQTNNQSPQITQFTTNYTYTKTGKLTRVETCDGLVQESIFDTDNTLTSQSTYHISDPLSRFVSVGDSLQNDSNCPNATDNVANKSHTLFGTDFNSGRLKAISASADGAKNATRFEYEKGFLTALRSGSSSGINFEYEYDNEGRKTRVFVNRRTANCQPYIVYGYATETQGALRIDVVTANYPNGEIYQSRTDSFGRLHTLRHILRGVNTVILQNTYGTNRNANTFGKLLTTLDRKSHLTTSFTYDRDGNVISETTTGGQGVPLRLSQTFNPDNTLNTRTYVVANRIALNYNFGYDDNQQLTEINLPSTDTLKITTDNLNRLEKTSLDINGGSIATTLSTEYCYYQNGKAASDLVRALTQKVGNKTLRFRYCYNSSGAVTKVGNNFEQTVGEYTYDDLGRLVKEVDAKGNKSEWGYDTNGNILFKKHTKAGETDAAIKEYVYDNNERLVSLVRHSERSEESSVSENFVYDALGNPTTYRDNTLTWTHLRNLASVQTPRGIVTFEYNNQNLRRRRTTQNQRIDYTWSNGKMISETHSIVTGPNPPIIVNPNSIVATLDYFYGIDETPMGFILTTGQGPNTTHQIYYYVKNLQGDVVQVVGTNGQVVAEYAYDAWGNHEIVTSVGDVAHINPIRYRSYYYDNETSLYYLKSRYYDSETGRFINADAIQILELTKTDINGLNLFAYCGNDPINYIDHTGYIRNFLRNTWNNVVDFGRGVGSGFVNSLENTWNTITNPRETWNSIVEDPLGTAWGIMRNTASLFSPTIQIWDMWQAYQAGGWYGVGNVKGGRVADAALMVGSAGVGAGVVRGLGFGLRYTGRGVSTIRVNRANRVLNAIAENPTRVHRYTLKQVRGFSSRASQWQSGVLKQGRSVGRGFETLSRFDGRRIQWSPGSPRHFGGRPYWKVSSGRLGVWREMQRRRFFRR